MTYDVITLFSTIVHYNISSLADMPQSHCRTESRYTDWTLDSTETRFSDDRRFQSAYELDGFRFWSKQEPSNCCHLKIAARCRLSNASLTPSAEKRQRRYWSDRIIMVSFVVRYVVSRLSKLYALT